MIERLPILLVSHITCQAWPFREIRELPAWLQRKASITHSKQNTHRMAFRSLYCILSHGVLSPCVVAHGFTCGPLCHRLSSATLQPAFPVSRSGTYMSTWKTCRILKPGLINWPGTNQFLAHVLNTHLPEQAKWSESLILNLFAVYWNTPHWRDTR